MKKILFVVDEMRMGGVSRVLIELLKHLDRDKYAIDLLVLHYHGEMIKDIPGHVKVLKGTPFFAAIDIPLRQCHLNELWHKFKIIFYMKTGLIFNKIKRERKKILTDDYDVEIAYKEGFCTVFVASGNSTKKLDFIHSDYKVENYAKNYMATFKKTLAAIDMNIAVSDVVNSSFKEVFGVKNVMTIHNVIDEDRIKKRSHQAIDFTYDDKKINLISVGRLHYQKGYDILLKAYKKVSDHYTLTILGDGPQRDRLMALKEELGIDVSFLGQVDNPYPYISKADLFVLSSRYEGYPTVTIESLILSTPVLAFEVAGIDEQITEEKCGFVIENSYDALCTKLIELKDKKDMLLRYKDELKDYHYKNSDIIAMIETLLDR